MKGISTILAMILIVIIVVALIGLTYTFAVGLFSTTTTGATQQTQAVTSRLQKSVALVSAVCINTTGTNLVIDFTIKHSGTVDIATGDLGAILDGSDVSSSTNEAPAYTTAISSSTLSAGKIKSYRYTSASRSSASKILTISAPAGEVSWSFTNCPT